MTHTAETVIFTSASSPSSLRLEEKIFRRLERLSGGFTILVGEDPEEFREVLSGVFHAIKPTDLIEELEVITIANALWEARRLSLLQSEAQNTRVKAELQARFAANLSLALHKKLKRSISGEGQRLGALLRSVLAKVGVSLPEIFGSAYRNRDPQLDQLRRLSDRSRDVGRSGVDIIDRRRA